jgi:hypothetical protein
MSVSLSTERIALAIFSYNGCKFLAPAMPGRSKVGLAI